MWARFSGSLSNGGEQITLQASDNSVVREFTYDDKSPWPESPDGDGFSLTLIDPGGDPDHADPFSWRASVRLVDLRPGPMRAPLAGMLSTILMERD